MKWMPRFPNGAIKGTALMGLLALSAFGLAGNLAGTVLAGEPDVHESVMAQVRSVRDRAYGPEILDTRTLTGPLAALFTHSHDGNSPEVRVRSAAFLMNPLSTAGALGMAAATPGAQTDAWSDLVFWMTHGATPALASPPIHATLLPDGRMSFIGWDGPFTITPSALGSTVPSQVTATTQSIPLDFASPATSGDWVLKDGLFCTAQTLTYDGKMFIASGTRLLYNLTSGQNYSLGLAQALTSDGNTWKRLPDMLGKGAVIGTPMRWYPTATRLADKRILVTGGYEIVAPWTTKNLSAETYNPITNAWTLVTPTGSLPAEAFSFLYSQVFQLPKNTARGDVLAFGDASVPTYMAANGTWSVSTAARPGAAGTDVGHLFWGSTSMLPLRATDGEWGYSNGSVMQVGGQSASPTASRIDVYDVATDRWTHPLDMGRVRAHPATVTLPDGRILVMGGEDGAGSKGLGRASYINPRNGFAIEPGTQEYPEVRGYHNVALLLPDGRVMFGSGNENYTRGELPSFRYYYPSYLFAASRPAIDAAQNILSYGHLGWLTFKGTTPPSEVVLMGLGAMTHSFDMNQRYIQLPIAANGSNYTIFSGPADTRVAPPGYYMLFILDANHVPSEAKIVQVQ